MSQAVPGRRQPLAQRVDILLRGKTGQADAQRPIDGPGVQADSLQHMAPPALFAGGAF